MGSRGPKSSAQLEVVEDSRPHEVESPVLVVQRPDAPGHLTDEQALIWTEIVESQPADHFLAGTYDLLAQYCRHCVSSRKVSQMISAAEEKEDIDILDLDRLYKMQERESRILTVLATKMKLSQQATTNHRGNKKGKPKISRPWESR